MQMGIPMGFDSPYPDIVALFQETVSKRNRREGISTVEIEASKALGCGFKSRPFLKKRRLLKLMAEAKNIGLIQDKLSEVSRDLSGLCNKMENIISKIQSQNKTYAHTTTFTLKREETTAVFEYLKTLMVFSLLQVELNTAIVNELESLNEYGMDSFKKNEIFTFLKENKDSLFSLIQSLSVRGGI